VETPSEIPKRHREAAQGWLMLGRPDYAREELDQLPAAVRRAPETAELEWRICAAMEDWEAACALGRRLTRRHPERPAGWILHAYALRRVPASGVARAREVLEAAAEKFPREPVIPYNLACYAAVEGRREEAWEWLQRARRLAGAAPIRKLALADEDLAALHERIRRQMPAS
jgi:Flp pilus assembly protein TadD